MTANIDVASVASFILIVPAWLHQNKRVDDINLSLHRRIDDLKSIIQAEAAATRSEIRADREVFETKLKNKVDR